jgi:hypothetical protein
MDGSGHHLDSSFRIYRRNDERVPICVIYERQFKNRMD